MRIFLLILAILNLACNHKDLIDVQSDRFTFKLIDSLGEVSMAYPQRTDTFFSWIHKSDCGKPCENGKYRFQSKANEIFKESGWYWTGEPIDSVEQLTVYHQRGEKFIKSDDSVLSKNQPSIVAKYFTDFELGDIISDTLIRINNRDFIVLKIADIRRGNNVRHRSLFALTLINGVFLHFHYKLLHRDYDSVLTNFFDRSLENLKTIVIHDGG